MLFRSTMLDQKLISLFSFSLQVIVSGLFSSLIVVSDLVKEKKELSERKSILTLGLFLFYFWLCWIFFAAWAFSSFGDQGLLFVALHGLLIVVVSLVAEHGL